MAKTSSKKKTSRAQAAKKPTKKTVAKARAKPRKVVSTKKRPSGAKSAKPQISARTVNKLTRRIHKLTALLDVAKAMTAERDLDRLLRLILDEAKQVLEADRCTIWIVDREKQQLWTRVAHGLQTGQTLRMPMGTGIAGQVALSGKIINIADAYADERFNRQVDKDTGYKTLNMLAVPMYYTTGEVTGVLQTLNKTTLKAFTEEDTELALALGANAASAIENAILHEELDQLFEGFVRAAAVAIESRDPSTSGHSGRVATLTLGLAEQVNQCTHPDLPHMSEQELRELRYAALLHDFGKVGVREPVLVKADRLYPGERAAIESNFVALMAQRQSAWNLKRYEGLKEKEGVSLQHRQAFENDIAHIKQLLETVRRCNQPSQRATPEDLDMLDEACNLTYKNADGQDVPVLTALQRKRLSVSRGSLDDEERQEIESHVTHSYNFLRQIPWMRGLKQVPEIAYGHHEKLDGKGYPRNLTAEDIPLQCRIMAIADMYDALTASDRPYKKAVPHEKAIAILEQDCAANKLDRVLFDLFVSKQIYAQVREPNSDANDQAGYTSSHTLPESKSAFGAMDTDQCC